MNVPITCTVSSNSPLQQLRPWTWSSLLPHPSTSALFTHFQPHCSAWAHSSPFTAACILTMPSDWTTAFIPIYFTYASFLSNGTFVGLSYKAIHLASLFYLLTCFIFFFLTYNLFFILSFSDRCPFLEQNLCVGKPST